MWSRQALKSKAIKFYRSNFMPAYFAGLFLTLFSDSNFQQNIVLRSDHSFIEFGNHTFAFNFINIAVLLLLLIAIKVIIGYLIEIGVQNYFLQGARSETSFYEVGFGLRSDNKFNIIMTLVMRDIKIFLWTLLLIIPGIIKHYEYSMTPYILADNPDMSPSEIHQYSREITDGHKMNMLILDLSFIGWTILGLMLFGIGVTLVTPYYNATKAQLYLSLTGNQSQLYQPDDFYDQAF